MAHRQVETTSIHNSTYHTGWIRIAPDEAWQVVAHNAEGDSKENVLACTYLDLATHIHMHRSSQQNRKYPRTFRWNRDVNFHDNLKVPDDGEGVLVLFEGKLTLVLVPRTPKQMTADEDSSLFF